VRSAACSGVTPASSSVRAWRGRSKRGEPVVNFFRVGEARVEPRARGRVGACAAGQRVAAVPCERLADQATSAAGGRRAAARRCRSS
jgi:hypothetical protein